MTADPPCQAPASFGHLLSAASQRLSALPQASPRLEAELLLMEATGASREQLIAWPELSPGPDQASRFAQLLERRLKGEPIAHIRGRQAFWKQELRVSPATLIPRPETELLVEIALDLLPAMAPLVVADAGTGTGAIALALALERPHWTLIALELSPDAIRVAAANRARLRASNLHLIRGDWLLCLAPASLDSVIANPPYIPAGDPHLGQGDLPREPLAALAAGADGLEAIRRLVPQAVSRLRVGGLLALEHGHDQDAAVRAELAAGGFSGILTHTDLCGHPRVTLGYRS